MSGMERRKRILNKLIRVKREGEVGGWEGVVWLVGSTAIMVDVVAMLDASYGCFLGVAMSMSRAYCSRPSSQKLWAKSALCVADK